MEGTVNLSETNLQLTRSFPGAGGKNSPLGFLFCFHGRVFYVVTESQHHVHKSQRKTKQRNLHLKKLLGRSIYLCIYTYIHTHIYILGKNPERRRKRIKENV